MINGLKPLDSLAGIVILAGGASKRMGTAKAALMLPTGECLLDYHVRHALDLAQAHTGNNKDIPIMVADNGRGFHVGSELMDSESQAPVMHIADYGANMINDQNADRQNSAGQNSNGQISNSQIHTGGALVAIESALQTVIKTQPSDALTENQSSWLLVISCDSLIPATELWQKLQSVATQINKNQEADKKVICLTDDSHLYPLLGLYPLSLEPDLKAYIDNGARRVMPFIKPYLQAVSFPNSWQYLTNFNTPTDFERACHSLSTLSMSDY
ncbi:MULTISPECIES: molybdenum cofactor guanylyltransferase [Psychrobacter]|uniref:NTP transferase domain-containing protein n=1 Tax=Psychrobacter halodurans TaxID=2818439 RepID=A0AAW4IV42_9GAMM|nr:MULTISPECIES: NTP transferase domain-containing protein [Psychrobacter]MBO1516628.1 NTP transferase domain-containing protein [Psychrobacter halodurans]PJX24792.1 molybdenum cofactor guanylyltransferase [Psychrobacter sp. L7]